MGTDGIRTPDVLETVTFSLDTSAYADGDVLAAPQEITNVFIDPEMEVTLQSLRLLDKDDQGVAMDILFLKSEVDIGAENAAYAITDAEAEEILTAVNIATGNYTDWGDWQIAMKSASAGDTGMGMLMRPSAAAGTSLWVALITRGGTPTYTASGLVLDIGLKRG